jgi:hypothetical protein
MPSSNGTGGGLWSLTTTWAGGVLPADGETVTIAAGDTVTMDFDSSLYTGYQTVTITSDATTPGMLRFMTGTSGYLKVRTGYHIVGTNAAAKGRLLANADGVWGHTEDLPYADKAVILLEGTSQIQAGYLDISLYCTEPAHFYVRTYKTAYACTDQTTDVDPVTNIITFTSAPPAAGTAVQILSSGTFPGGLAADVLYFVRTVSGNTCKLSKYNGDIQIVDITSTGSGTLTMYDGHINLSTKTLNIVDNVLADPQWVTTAGHNKVILGNCAFSADSQKDTLFSINAGDITLTTTNIDSVQYPFSHLESLVLKLLSIMEGLRLEEHSSVK